MTVRKYEFPQGIGICNIKMPNIHKILRIAYQQQFDRAYLWALVDTESPDTIVKLLQTYTGKEEVMLAVDDTYIGSIDVRLVVSHFFILK